MRIEADVITLSVTEAKSIPIFFPREIEVLQGLAKGLSAKQLAETMGISAGSVKAAKERIVSSVDPDGKKPYRVNLTQAVVIGVKENLIDTASLPRTPRVKLNGDEERILELIVEGLSTREISQELTLPRRIIENVVRKVFWKLGVSNRYMAVAMLLTIAMRKNDMNGL